MTLRPPDRNHRMFLHLTKPGTISVPMHARELKIGTERSILEQAGRLVMKRSYLVVYEKGRKNYCGFSPDIFGCTSAGETLDEMRANMKQAIEDWMQVSAEFGDALPEAITESITLPIDGELYPKTTYVAEFLTVALPKPARVSRSKHPVHELVAA